MRAKKKFKKNGKKIFEANHYEFGRFYKNLFKQFIYDLLDECVLLTSLFN